MFWIKKVELKLKNNGKKFVLERVSLFGSRTRVKFIETSLYSASRSSKTNVVSVTQRRRGWRFRNKHPIRTTYYKKNAKGKWVRIGTVLP